MKGDVCFCHPGADVCPGPEPRSRVEGLTTEREARILGENSVPLYSDLDKPAPRPDAARPSEVEATLDGIIGRALAAAFSFTDARAIDGLRVAVVAQVLAALREAGTPPEPAGLRQSGMVETAFSPWYRGRCVTPLPGCWAGDGSEDEGRVTAAACAHTLEAGHETSVTRESSHHYLLSEPAPPEEPAR